MSIPPIIRAISTVIVAVNTLIWSDIWIANSLVGVIITQNIPYGSLDRSWIIGSANAAVFPDPVCAPPITCLPFKIAGIVFAWISVGWTMPTSLAAFASHPLIPSSSKVVLQLFYKYIYKYIYHYFFVFFSIFIFISIKYHY